MFFLRKKTFFRVFAVFLTLFSFLIGISAYKGTLTFEGEVVQLSLTYSILLGLAFFICSYALISFIGVAVYSLIDDKELK